VEPLNEIVVWAPCAPVGEIITPATDERSVGRSRTAIASIAARSMLVVPADGARSLMGSKPSTTTEGSSTVWENTGKQTRLTRQRAAKAPSGRTLSIPSFLLEVEANSREESCPVAVNVERMCGPAVERRMPHARERGMRAKVAAHPEFLSPRSFARK
jgi:hypothetical protein